MRRHKQPRPSGWLILLLLLFPLAQARCTRSSSIGENEGGVASFYLIRHPPPGSPAYILDLKGAKQSRKLLGVSLQGVVNHKAARIYILGGDPAGERPWEGEGERESAEFWSEVYRNRYGIPVAGTATLETLLEQFRSEINGYIRASLQEPWTINLATTLAGLEGALIVAGEEEESLMATLNIPKVRELRAVYTEEISAYRDLARTYEKKPGRKGIAVIAPEEYRLRDFAIAQELLVLHTRPGLPSWNELSSLLEDFPSPVVYGYMSLDGLEEFLAVSTLSRAGKTLVPSDTTANLSFHSAFSRLPPDREHFSFPSGTTCPEQGSFPVVVAISDGDNLAIPLNFYAQSRYLRSPLRGKLPLGLSFSPALFVLAPLVADYFLSTAPSQEEWVAMMGPGYALPSFLPRTQEWIGLARELLAGTPVSTFWELDPVLQDPLHPFWEELVRGFSPNSPSLSLLGYGAPLFKPGGFRTPRGLHVLTPGNRYEDNALALRAWIERMKTASSPPPVLFVSASVWVNDLETLTPTLLPLQQEKVQFLLPREVGRCKLAP